LVAETAALAPQAQCIGFKLFPEHGEQLLAFVCTAPEIAVVTLERADRLAQWASLQIALRTGAWVHTMGEVGDTRVRFEPARFAAWCERLDTDARRIERLLWRKRRCHVLYEDLTGEPEARAAALARVVDTIGAGPAPLRMPTIRRQDCRPARERFSNPEAVDAALADPALRLLMRPAPRPGR
ncbi:MAG: hypothetical protein HXY25_04675, partial [Alphaproteobacteria bacterium]|nr:hypothetical protein [Alphaproteobacteria bacterium]